MKVKLFFVFIPLLFFLSALAQAPPWQWARQGATNGSEVALDVCTDVSSTDIYVCGSFDGNLNSVYGSSLSASAGQSDGFVLKYDALGTIVWGFKIGGTGTDEIRGIATDPAGNVYAMGSFNGTCDFDPSPSSFNLTSANRDGFLAKYNSLGAFQWAVKFGGSNSDNVWGLYADGNGIYVTGHYMGIAAFNSTSGPANLITAQGNEDLFGVKYNSSGVVQWVISQGASNRDVGYEVVADNNNVYFIGTYSDGINLYNTNGNLATSRVSEQSNKTSVIISAYTQAGVLVWANNISSTDDNEGLGISQDATDIYITGSISNTAKFRYPNPSFTMTTTSNDIFLAKLSKSSGAFSWVSSQTGSGNGSEVGYDLEVNNNTVIILGAFSSALNYQPFGGPQLTANNMDPFLSCFDLSGNYLWAAQGNGPGADSPAGLAINNTGGVFICGAYGSGINFGNFNLTSANSTNIFVAKIGCDSILSNLVAPSLQTVCAGSIPATITGTVSVAGPNYLTQWQTSINGVNWTNASGTSTNTNYSPPALSVDTYFRRVVSGAGTCTNFSNSPAAFVVVDQLPVSIAGADQFICVNNPATTLAAVSPTLGQGVWSILSGTATLVTPTLATTSVTTISSGTVVLQWAVTNGVCAAVNSTMAINVSPLTAQAIAGRDQQLCSVSTTLAAVTPSAGTGYWQVLAGTGIITSTSLASNTVSSMSAGLNSFLWTVSNNICPPSYDTVFVIVDQAPAQAFASTNQTVCSKSVKMQAAPASVGRGWWQLVFGPGIFADSTLNTTTIDSLAPGKNVFRWSVINGVCPSSSDEVTVWRDVPAPATFAGNNQQVEIPVATLSAETPTFGVGYWQVVSGTGVLESDSGAVTRITGLSTGNNVVRWNVKNGVCPASTSDLEIYLEPLKIPNGFSPNGDGINDLYVIPGIDYYEQADFSVFNRWGGLVYHNTSYKNEWDGSNTAHEPLADDTYYFTLKISSSMSFNGYIIIKSAK